MDIWGGGVTSIYVVFMSVMSIYEHKTMVNKFFTPSTSFLHTVIIYP